MSEPVVLELKEGIRFPPFCARCDVPASKTLMIRGTFYRGEDSAETHSIWPYFCDACIAEHQKEAPPPAVLKQLQYLVFNQSFIPLALFGPLTLLMVFKMMQAAARGEGKTVLFLGILGTLFGLICWACGLSVRSHMRSKMVDPITSVTAYVRFTDSLAQVFEPTWRRYTFRNAEYGERVAQLNAGIVWDRRGTEASRAFTYRFYGKWVVYAVVAALFVYWLYDDYGRDILNWIRETW